jgi:hypothetical protein
MSADDQLTIQFVPATEDDLEQIIEWQSLDESKSGDLPFGFWLTGSSDNPLTAKVLDDQGVVLYLRMDREGLGLRMQHLVSA